MTTANIKALPQRRITNRSLWNQFWTVLLQPNLFFRTLPALENTRQWLWIGLLILMLVGGSAARHEALLSAPEAAPANETPMDGSLDPRISGGGGEVIVDGGIPPGGAPAAVETETPSMDLTTGLIAASSVLVWWGVLTILLCEVTLLNGKTPRLGQNFQVAVWSSVPLGVMGAIQLLYFATGGKAGAAGVSGVLPEWSGYADLPELGKLLLLSLSIRLTIFWLWSVILVGVGARVALNGKHYAVAIVLVMWVLTLIAAPALTGAVKIEEEEEEITTEPLEMMPMEEIPMDRPMDAPVEGEMSDMPQEAPAKPGKEG